MQSEGQGNRASAHFTWIALDVTDSCCEKLLVFVRATVRLQRLVENMVILVHHTILNARWRLFVQSRDIVSMAEEQQRPQTTSMVKLRGYDFYRAIGSPKRIVAPMVSYCSRSSIILLGNGSNLLRDAVATLS